MFYGQAQKCCEAGGFTFEESVYTAEWQLQLPLHTHENSFLHMVVEGVCEEFYGRTTRIGCPSALAFHPAGEPHANRWHGAGGRVFHIDISPARAKAVRDYAPAESGPAEFRGGVAPWLARRLYREYQRPDSASLLAMEGLTLEILAETCRHRAPRQGRTPPRWLLRARELLHARFAEKLSLDEIAAAAGVHPMHFARVFRGHFGCTAGDYLRRLRVESACRQLASSNTPLSEVALSAGFADQSHFTKTFRRFMQMTPGEFRRNFRPR
jgi:AraC family transcriptional regulator